MKRISMVLIDDNPSAREGVVARIRAEPGFHVLADRVESAEALQSVRETRPDLVLLNLAPGAGETMALAGALHDEMPGSRVVVMGLTPLHKDVAGFLRAGVSGFIMADAAFDEVLATISSISRGVGVLPSGLTHSLFGQLTGHGLR
jgi:two-component system, NarL family, response regulator NreC